MDLKQVQAAIKQIALEKGLEVEDIQNTLNTALAAAYRKDFGNKNQNITFQFNPETGDMEVWDTKIVVNFDDDVLDAIREHGADKKYVHGHKLEEEVEYERDGEVKKRTKTDEELEREMAEFDEEVVRYNPKTDILLGDAKEIKKSYKVGDEIITKLEIPSEFGRMAAQTAKQVIIQKLREAERDKIFEDFKDRAGETVNAFVQRRDGRNVLIDLGNATGIMPPDHQIRSERYNVSDRLKVYIVSVEKTIKGPEIVVSRAHPQLITGLFSQEIPEIEGGAIEIKAVAREGGARSKVSVISNDDSIDPIGSCVGQRGARIQTIISELGGEKIDIIEYEEDPAKYIANALSPAKVLNVTVKKTKNPEEEGHEGEATVTVPEDQLSLAIGKEGQNVRLAAKLTGWKINVLKEGDEDLVEVNTDLEEEIEEDLEEKGKTVAEDGDELIEIKDEENIDEEKKEEEKMQDQDPAEAEVIDEPVEAEESIVGDEPKKKSATKKSNGKKATKKKSIAKKEK